MYLEQATVERLLTTAAGLSAEGSVFVGLSLTAATLERLRGRGGWGTEAGVPKLRKSATTSLMDTWVFGCPDDPAEVRRRWWRRRRRRLTVGLVALGERMCEQPETAALPPQMHPLTQRDSSCRWVHHHVVPPQFFRSCRWQLQHKADRSVLAAALALDPRLIALDRRAPDSGTVGWGGSLFLTATPIAAADQ